MTTIVFVCQYINTGLLVVIASLDLYPDFTNDWYIVVGGQIQQTMIVQSFIPYVMFGINWGLKVIFRLKDSRNITLKPKIKTNKKTKQGFMELYAGTVPKMHLR